MLKGRNIYLRALEITDVEFILSVENNKDNWEVSGTNKPYTEQQIQAYILAKQTLNTHCQERFVVCLNNNQSIGCIDLFEYDNTKTKAGIGIIITTENRGKGYAKEALKLLIEYCKKELYIKTLFCNIFKNNFTSINLFESCGFRYIEEKELYEKPVKYFELDG